MKPPISLLRLHKARRVGVVRWRSRSERVAVGGRAREAAAVLLLGSHELRGSMMILNGNLKRCNWRWNILIWLHKWRVIGGWSGELFFGQLQREKCDFDWIEAASDCQWFNSSRISLRHDRKLVAILSDLQLVCSLTPIKFERYFDKTSKAGTMIYARPSSH